MKLTLSLYLVAGLLAQSLCALAQDVTHLSAWSEDPFKSTRNARVLVSQNAVSGTNSLRVKTSLSCRRKDDKGNTVTHSFIEIHFAFTAPGIQSRIDTRSESVPHTTYENAMCPFPGNPVGIPGWAPCQQPVTTYTSESRTYYYIDSQERFGEGETANFSDLVGSPRTTDYSFTRDLDKFEISPGKWITQYLYGFKSGNNDLVFHISPDQPAVSRFLAECKAPSLEQQALIQKIEDDAALAAKAEEERKVLAAKAEEERKIAAAKAEEERLAREHEAAEAARVAKEKADRTLAENIAAIKRRRDSAIAQTFNGKSSPPKETELSSLLVGRNAIPKIELGYSGTLGNAALVNGRPKVFTINTLVFPDGSEAFRVESGIMRGNAVSYKTFKPGLEFRIDKVEFRSDNLEIKLSIVSTSEKADIKLMLPKDWEKTLNGESVLSAVEKSLIVFW